MPAAHLYQQLCTGHGCWPPRPNAEASPNVYCENIRWHRHTDRWQSHCCVSCHTSVTAKGSQTVYVNNLQAARIGDPVACGSYCLEGAKTVFAGG